MTPDDTPLVSKRRNGWSLVSFACPICAVGLGVIVGRTIKDEDFGMRIVGFVGYSFVALSLVALVGAFIRKEKMKWFTVLPLILLAALFGLGVST